MDKPTQRENFLLGYASKRSFEGPSSSRTLDFNDIFGGPPRRFSLQEKTRHSSDGSVVDADDQTALFRRLSNEKPVYGEESSGSSSMNSRRKSLQNSDFYDDIFQGDQKYSSTSPQKVFLNYLPQSLHNMSPSFRALPPKSEPVGSLFSLPVTMKEGMNSPAFSSSSSFKQKNVTSHGISSTTSSLSRFSSQPMQENDDLKNDVYTSNRPRPLSNEFPKAESSNVTKVNETEEISNRLKRSYSYNGRIRSDKAQVKREETIHIFEEDIPIRPKPEVLETTQVTVEKLRDNVDTPISLTEETAKIISKSKDKSFRMEVKSLRSVLQDEIERLDNEDVVMKRKGEGKTAKTTKESRSNNGGNKTEKKREKKKTNSDIVEPNKATTNTPGSPKKPGVNIKRRGVGGKVKDFAKIFNQEMNSKPKSDARNQSQSCRWERKLDGGEVNKGSFSTKEINYIDMNKMPDSFFMVNENVVKPEKKHSYKLKGGSQSSESILDDSQVISDDSINDDPFQESYLIEELYDDQDNVAGTSEDLESTKDLDTEIVKWSTGKIGNVRSLLSTLHYVLWEESGWNPVPLVDIIEGNAVKRAYQKALLCLHPDKLQQKGAASHQKYIAEKVFEILQEAWDHFNTLSSI